MKKQHAQKQKQRARFLKRQETLLRRRLRKKARLRRLSTSSRPSFAVRRAAGGGNPLLCGDGGGNTTARRRGPAASHANHSPPASIPTRLTDAVLDTVRGRPDTDAAIAKHSRAFYPASLLSAGELTHRPTSGANGGGAFDQSFSDDSISDDAGMKAMAGPNDGRGMGPQAVAEYTTSGGRRSTSGKASASVDTQIAKIAKPSREPPPEQIDVGDYAAVHNVVWPFLKSEGWTHSHGRGVCSYAYHRPGHPKKRRDDQGKTWFNGEQELVAFLHKEELELIQGAFRRASKSLRVGLPRKGNAARNNGADRERTGRRGQRGAGAQKPANCARNSSNAAVPRWRENAAVSVAQRGPRKRAEATGTQRRRYRGNVAGAGYFASGAPAGAASGSKRSLDECGVWPTADEARDILRAREAPVRQGAPLAFLCFNIRQCLLFASRVVLHSALTRHEPGFCFVCLCVFTFVWLAAAMPPHIGVLDEALPPQIFSLLGASPSRGV